MWLKIPKLLLALFVVGALILGGCSTDGVASDSSNSAIADANQTSETETAKVSKDEPVQLASASPNSVESTNNMTIPKLEGKATVEMKLKGSEEPIIIELDGENAPVTAGNFVDLVQKGVYDGLVFHRVIGPTSNPPEQPFVAQGGDPKGNGSGGFIDKETGRERTVPLEIKPLGADEPVYSKTLKAAGVSKPPELQHKQGAIAMARSGQPDSASSQFYFALADLPFLDGDYAVFGYVTDGMSTVNKIKQGDRIESAKVIKGAENLKKAS
ncbi:MAG: peptidylprolyl isomerase [Cyanobacteria bacterium P01_A01_bin.84]